MAVVGEVEADVRCQLGDWRISVDDGRPAAWLEWWHGGWDGVVDLGRGMDQVE